MSYKLLIKAENVDISLDIASIFNDEQDFISLNISVLKVLISISLYFYKSLRKGTTLGDYC